MAIKSNVADAEMAVSGFKETTERGKNTILGESNIIGMQEAVEVSN
jgi:hypothetical protein